MATTGTFPFFSTPVTCHHAEMIVRDLAAGKMVSSSKVTNFMGEDSDGRASNTRSNRREDIPLLLGHYLAEAAEELGTPAKVIDAEALDALQDFSWPGNVRQLVNASRRLTVTAPGGVITAQDIPEDLGGTDSPRRASKEWTRMLAAWAERQILNSEQPLIDQAMPEFEKTLIEAAMSKTNGHRQEAAKLLGWGRNTLTRKMKALHLD